MTLATENASRFATTPEQRLREDTNAALNLLDEKLRDSIGTPGMYEWLDRVAARLEELGAK